MMSYIARSIEPVLARAVAEFPVITLSGPRQSGKTTLLRHLFAHKIRYISLETPEMRNAAIEDPRSFLELNPPPLILDEVQNAPNLLHYIKERVDEERERTGQYILTGSQDLLLAENVGQTLAGRTAVLHLFPLTEREIKGTPDLAFPWERKDSQPDRTSLPLDSLWRNILRGGFPDLVTHPERDAALWHGSYTQTYLERDVRSIRQVGDLFQFQSFLATLAARNAQLLNLTDISRDLGVAVNTIKAWISVLVATHQVLIIRPYHANIGKRMVKTPKLYFTDTGTLCYLNGLRDPEQARTSSMAGALFESAAVNEIYRTLSHRGEQPRLYFWRTQTGDEVDLIVDRGTELIPIELKSSATPNARMARGIETFRKALPEQSARGYIIHPGDVKIPVGKDAMAWPFGDL